MINTVKIQGDGYLIDDTLRVPKAEGNRHYKEVLEWLASGNEVLPEFTDEDLAAQEQATINQEALEYLASTDWYVVRFTEIGEAIPVEVTTKRAEARIKIS